MEKHTEFSLETEDIARRLVRESGLNEGLRNLARHLYPELSSPFENVEKILCIQPHPDDCELGAGGTIADLTSKDVEVVYLTLTDGSMGTSDPGLNPRVLAEVRKHEQEEAARVLGVSKIIPLDYKDTELPYTLDARNRIISVVRMEHPDIVLAPDPWLMYEIHPDHRVAGLLASDAVMFSSLPHVVPEHKPHIVAAILYYYTAKPNYFHDITATLERKLQALSKHKSQFEPIWPILEEQVKTLAAAYGQASGRKYAEAFRVIPLSVSHATPLSELV
jgi:LmbE family N-acetylglucosaminyl deacetylase